MNNAQAQQAQQPYITIEEGERYHDSRAVMFTLYNHGEAVGSYTACIGADGRCSYHCHLIGEDGDAEAFCEVDRHYKMMRRLIEHFTPSSEEPVARVCASDISTDFDATGRGRTSRTDAPWRLRVSPPSRWIFDLGGGVDVPSAQIPYSLINARTGETAAEGIAWLACDWLRDDPSGAISPVGGGLGLLGPTSDSIVSEDAFSLAIDKVFVDLVYETGFDAQVGRELDRRVARRG